MNTLLADRIFILICTLSIVAVILSTGYKFFILKDYNFVLEAFCDPVAMTCFSRDCSEPDSCPPNNFEHYRLFSVMAGDFQECSDNSCLSECENGNILCEEIFCDDDLGDECSIGTE